MSFKGKLPYCGYYKSDIRPILSSTNTFCHGGYGKWNAMYHTNISYYIITYLSSYMIYWDYDGNCGWYYA